MGGTPVAELYLLYRRVEERCRERGLTVVRSLVGSYVTSLEMRGCSLTLVPFEEDLVALWDAPVRTAGLRWGA